MNKNRYQVTQDPTETDTDFIKRIDSLEKLKFDPTIFKEMLDKTLKELNDDYATERISVLKEIIVDILPESKFMDFMIKKEKVGGQHKFPRVLKGDIYQEWVEFLKSEG